MNITIKRITLITIVAGILSVLAMIGNTEAQIAGSTTLGVAVAELKDITAG
jgi:hypothetical protein